MCDKACIEFGMKNISCAMIVGGDVLEVGSCDVNGSLRAYITRHQPKSYIGVDISCGPGVDIVCSAYDLVKQFRDESFDFVLSTEMLEHVKDWKIAISQIKAVCKKGGHMLITTRSRGFSKHNWPADYWRFETGDLHKIFKDCMIIEMGADRFAPGVFILAQKPAEFKEVDYDNIKLYNINEDIYA